MMVVVDFLHFVFNIIIKKMKPAESKLTVRMRRFWRCQSGFHHMMTVENDQKKKISAKEISILELIITGRPRRTVRRCCGVRGMLLVGFVAADGRLPFHSLGSKSAAWSR